MSQRADWMPEVDVRKYLDGIGLPTHCDYLVRLFAAQTGVSVERIRGRGHDSAAVKVRHAVWAALRESGWSASAIGREFGRDHTTVLAALKKGAR